jgi:hypothetical protein
MALLLIRAVDYAAAAMTNELRSELRSLVDSIAASIVDDLERIVQHHAVRLVAERLGTTLTVERLNGGRPRGPAPKPAPKQGNDASRILEHVRANPGDRSEKIRAALGLGKGEWVYALNRLIAEKRIERKGEKRASTLYAR